MKKQIRRIVSVILLIAMLLLDTTVAFAVDRASDTGSFEIPVLMYHSVSDINPQNSTSITPVEKFRTEMEMVKQAGFETILLKEYTAYIKKGTPLPDNPIIITFDDGYLDNYTNAYPILKELGMKATISIVVSSVGLSEINGQPIYPHFTWEQAKEMYDSGLIDIQCHTYDLHKANTPKGLAFLPDENVIAYKARIKQDLSMAKALIEKNVGNTVDVFVYPYGLYNTASEEVVKDLGFRYSITVDDGISDFKDGGYLIKRINMTPRVPSVELIKKLFVEDTPPLLKWNEHVEGVYVDDIYA